MRAQLLPIDHGKPVELGKDITLVGRSEVCDLKLDHKSVSKLHCVIVKTDGLLLLRDLGSTNGTRVNGQRVRRAALLPNDQLFIASMKFRVVFGPKALPPISPEEQTQQIDAEEMEKVLQKRETDKEELDSEDISLPPIQANPLPDVYVEDGSKIDKKQ